MSKKYNKIGTVTNIIIGKSKANGKESALAAESYLKMLMDILDQIETHPNAYKKYRLTVKIEGK